MKMGGPPSICSSFFSYFTLFLITTTTTIITAVNVDIKTKGAVGDGKSDDTKALRDAWKEACGSKEPSQVVIPPGMYMMGSQVLLEGPCRNPIQVIGEGATVLAPTDPKAIKTDSWIAIKNVNNMTLSGGNFDGQGQEAWKAAKAGKIKLPYNIIMDMVKDSTIREITSRNSKQFHIQMVMCDNTVLEKVTIDGPPDTPNTDGISVFRTNGFKILESIIKTGDACIKIGGGSKNVHIEETSCGPGHGFSIGSLGKSPKEEPVDGIFVKGCTISNTEEGIRVKTWPGSTPGIATRMHFEDVIMENVGNPIFIDQEYCPDLECNPETNSSRVKISDVLFKGIRGTSSTKYAMTFLCSKAVPCEQVVLQDIDLKYEGSEGGPGAISGCKNVQPKVIGKVEPKPCTAPPDVVKKAEKEKEKKTEKGNLGGGRRRLRSARPERAVARPRQQRKILGVSRKQFQLD